MKPSQISTRNFRNHQFHRLLPLGLFLLLIHSGCSDASGYTSPTNLIDVVGEVTLDGKPLADATLHFVPGNHTAGTGGFAVTDSEGQFNAQHYSRVYGLEPGTYRVTFSRLLMNDGTPIPEGKDAADVGALESLPPHLVQLNPENHPYLVTVSSTAEVVTFELSSKKKR